MSTFGKNLKELRVQSGMSQKVFATKMQTTQQRVSEWETDKVEPTLYNILKIISVLQVTFEDLTEGIADTTKK
jgi:transcriptional regulator with XRE-family HTH domain